MPRLSSFYGIVVYMYWTDHPPPHFHAEYGENQAVIAIADGSLVDHGTVVWPNGLDLDPLVLHGDFDPAQRAPGS